MAFNSSVPHGSLLFVLLTIDLPFELSEGTDVVLYADDTKIWLKIMSPSDSIILQNDIACLKSWADRNKKKFHPSKCKVFLHILGPVSQILSSAIA